MKCRLNVNCLEAFFFLFQSCWRSYLRTQKYCFLQNLEEKASLAVRDRGGSSSWGNCTILVLLSMVQTLDSALPDFQHGEVAMFLLGNQTSAIERTKLIYAVAASDLCAHCCCTVNLRDICSAIVIFLPLNYIQRSLF